MLQLCALTNLKNSKTNSSFLFNRISANIYLEVKHKAVKMREYKNFPNTVCSHVITSN